MIPIQGLASLDPVQMVSDAVRRRSEQLEGDEVITLAQRITASTAGAIPCPTCWDADRKQITATDDPLCLGTGYIIPGPTGASDPATVHGYRTPVPFDCYLTNVQQQTEQLGQGYIEYTTAECRWEPQDVQPKRDDVLIVSDPRVPAPDTRYVFLDLESPHAFGRVPIFYNATVGLREHDDVVYAINTPDTAPPAAGTWE